MSNETQLKINDLTGEQITTVITSLGNKLENEVDNSTDYLYSLIGLPSFILSYTPIEQAGGLSLIGIPIGLTAYQISDIFKHVAFSGYTDSIRAAVDNELGYSTFADATPIDFNSQFDNYEGVQQGSNVISLIMKVKSYNLSDLVAKVECHADIEDIKSTENYIVSFEKDSEGYINKVIIEEQ